MAREIVFDDIGAFISILRDEEIGKVVVAETNEKRTLSQGPDALIVAHVYAIDVLAYKNSTIFKYTASGDESCRAAEDALAGAACEIMRRSRNIT